MAQRDQMFWKRFSMAIHQDEEYGVSRPEMKHSDSWLGRQQKKRSRRACFCWIFWLSFFALVAGGIAVGIWLIQSGLLSKVKLGNGNGTPQQPADPNSGVS